MKHWKIVKVDRTPLLKKRKKKGSHNKLINQIIDQINKERDEITYLEDFYGNYSNVKSRLLNICKDNALHNLFENNVSDCFMWSEENSRLQECRGMFEKICLSDVYSFVDYIAYSIKY